MTTFDEGAERNKALGIWGAIAGTGGAAGVLLGGILTAAAELVVDLLHQRPGRRSRSRSRPRASCARAGSRAARASFDLLGAVLATGGLSLLVYALVQTVDHSWTAPRTIGLFVGAAVLLVGFIATERRAQRAADAAAASSATARWPAPTWSALMLGASIFSMFFLLTLYMQQVLGYSALKTGVGYLLVSSVIIVSAGASQALVTRIGVRTVLATGMGADRRSGCCTSARSRSAARTWSTSRRASS